MDADSESKTDGVGNAPPNDQASYFWKVHDVRANFERRIKGISTKAALTIEDRLRLAYYQNVLRLHEPLSPETHLNAGYRMERHCSDHREEVREITQILDYLIPESGEMKTAGSPPPGSILLALPASARPSIKKGRPVTRRPSALRALQLQIDTGQTWPSITKKVCDCPRKSHDRCTEDVRQSVNDLKRLLRRLGIHIPPIAEH